MSNDIYSDISEAAGIFQAAADQLASDAVKLLKIYLVQQALRS